ncbi:ABC transporter permease [Lysinibacter cavernae]|uniref:Uncharacterized protein n=1 Tax=Lysinibacter cavernae TaxID=1640652 RepID=A0A7X5TS36_9MICO|nr:ABC transporter permease [Lysinibacter cavernae]NIH52450.1 hypothetical protein [Lysinibacter cavernae]
MARAIRAEFRKAFGLRSTSVAIGIAAFGTLALAIVNSTTYRNMVDRGIADEFLADGWDLRDAGFEFVPIVIGLIVCGVTVMSSEFTRSSNEVGGGRQLTTSLLATPRRWMPVLAKTVVVSIIGLSVCAVVLPLSVALGQLILGKHGYSFAESAAYIGWGWVGLPLFAVFTSLIGLAVTTLLRSGTVALIVLIVNSSVVPFSFLVNLVAPAVAAWLPDAAGTQMLPGAMKLSEFTLEPVTGGLVMAVWTVTLLAVAAMRFAKRDA